MRATETIIEQVPGGVTREGWGGLEIEADSGLGVEGFGGLR